MQLEKLNPWNWFKHEENSQQSSEQIPVKRKELSDPPTSTYAHPLNRVDRYFDEMARSMGFPSFFSQLSRPGNALVDFSDLSRPQIDVSGDNKEYQVIVDVPGFQEENLNIEITGDILTITGKKEQLTQDEDKHYYRVERNMGSVKRTLSIPDDADADGIEADLKDGVLTIHIPRKSAEDNDKDVKRIKIAS